MSCALRLLPLVAVCICAACARPVDVRPSALVELAPTARAGDSPAPGWRGRVVDVTRADGRTVRLAQNVDVLVVPVRGPARLFLRPVAARIEDGVLTVAGANRPASSIRVADVSSVSVYR